MELEAEVFGGNAHREIEVSFAVDGEVLEDKV